MIHKGLIPAGLLLLASVSVTRGLCEDPRAAPTIGPWRPLFQGIQLAEIRSDSPRPMRGHAVRIELRTPGLEFLATPSNGEKAGETDGLITGNFLVQNACQLAINASPFAPIHLEEGLPQDVHGLMVSRGEVVSEATDRPALLIDRDNRARVKNPPFELDRIFNAVAGFSIVLRQGNIVTGSEAIHPRTAAGISSDGRLLWLLVIDGRQPDYSEGATTAEVGVWLKHLGAHDGINLDGGGTTTLVIADETGQATLINRPIHAGIPGLQRVSASHLGVRAATLPAADRAEDDQP
jgi:hypothetical protein